MDEFRVSFVLRGWEKFMRIFFNFSRKESIIAYYQPYTGANSLLLGGVFSHDTMDKVGTNISVAYSSKSPCMRNQGSVVFLLSSLQRVF